MQQRPRVLAERVSLLGVSNAKAIALPVIIWEQHPLSEVGFDSFEEHRHAPHKT